MRQNTVTGTSSHFTELDALRGLAALAIVVTHVGQFSATGHNAWFLGTTDALSIGVVLFFVISGFVLYRPFARAARDGNRVRLDEYFTRRFFRIAPPYWFALATLALVFALPGVLTGEWWRYFGFLQVYENSEDGLAPAWTLCIEVTFYALLPLLALAIGALSRPLRGMLRAELVVIGALSVASVGFRSVLSSGAGPEWLHTGLYRTLPATILHFGLGMLLAAVMIEAPALASRLAAPRRTAAWGLSIAAAIFVIEAAVDTPFRSGTNYAFHGLLAIALVAAAVLAPADGRFRRVLRRRSLLALGLISYSLYLWHYPLVVWLSDHGFRPFGLLLITGVLSSLAVAAVAYRLVEAPSHETGRRLARRLRARRERRQAIALPAPAEQPA